MLDVLRDAEKILPVFLSDESDWESLYVDYHRPYVERLWKYFGPYRILLHRIHPCMMNETLFHPHPWPSAMHLISGTYEMVVGYGHGEEAPPVATHLILPAGTRYEMTDRDAWHAVRPIKAPSLSLMVIGPPWERWAPPVDRPLHPLPDDKRTQLFSDFRERYPR